MKGTGNEKVTVKLSGVMKRLEESGILLTYEDSRKMGKEKVMEQIKSVYTTVKNGDQT